MQYNITCILHTNGSNMFCSIQDFTFLMTDTKIKEQVFFESCDKKKFLPAQFTLKFVMLPARSIAPANWFYLHACLHEHDHAGLIDKPAIAQFPSFIGINFHFRSSFRLSCTRIRKVLLGHWDTFWILKIYSKLSWVLHLK